MKGMYLSQLPLFSNLKIFFQEMSEIRYKGDIWVKEPTFISEIFQKNWFFWTKLPIFWSKIFFGPKNLVSLTAYKMVNPNLFLIGFCFKVPHLKYILTWSFDENRFFTFSCILGVRGLIPACDGSRTGGIAKILSKVVNPTEILPRSQWEHFRTWKITFWGSNFEILNFRPARFRTDKTYLFLTLFLLKFWSEVFFPHLNVPAKVMDTFLGQKK